MANQVTVRVTTAGGKVVLPNRSLIINYIILTDGAHNASFKIYANQEIEDELLWEDVCRIPALRETGTANVAARLITDNIIIVPSGEGGVFYFRLS